MRLGLTRRGDYAVRAMLALAETEHLAAGAPSASSRSVRELAERMAIPPRILPSVMQRLSRAGLVTAREGRAGGYALARPAESISLLEVIEAVEGEMRLRTCVLRNAPCGARGECAVHAVFARAHDRLRDELRRPGITYHEPDPVRSA
ncbi:MAG: RrF2 family transcriptional regulator [Candidatus Limnocylindrales bacterium]